jgi:hypothetical protein
VCSKKLASATSLATHLQKVHGLTLSAATCVKEMELVANAVANASASVTTARTARVVVEAGDDDAIIHVATKKKSLAEVAAERLAAGKARGDYVEIDSDSGTDVEASDEQISNLVVVTANSEKSADGADRPIQLPAGRFQPTRAWAVPLAGRKKEAPFMSTLRMYNSGYVLTLCKCSKLFNRQRGFSKTGSKTTLTL